MQLRVVSLLYGAAYLEGRERAGLRLSTRDQKRLGELGELLAGDKTAGRRRHRRVSATLPALIKIGARYVPALILNMSAGGFLVASGAKLPEGQQIQLKVGSTEMVEYYFPCEVRRVTKPSGAFHLALRLSSIPLEIRHGGSEAEDHPSLPPLAALAQA